MKKIISIVLVLACFVFIPESLAKYTYVGPYNVIFNDTAHPMTGIGLDPTYRYVSGQELATYVSEFLYNNTTLYITILESKSDDFFSFQDVKNLTSTKALKGFKQIKDLDRIIDGLGGSVQIYKNVSNGQLLQKSTILCRVKQSGYSLDTHAAIGIAAINYTQEQFDFFLDSFEFSRLVAD